MDAATESGVELIPDNVDAVAREYVNNKYSEDASDPALSLINICVDDRFRGQGVGKLMLSRFIDEHAGEAMELCVLADNEPAVGLYQSMGFEIVDEAPGFSLSDEKPRCYDMLRMPQVR